MILFYLFYLFKWFYGLIESFKSGDYRLNLFYVEYLDSYLEVKDGDF